jgi:ribosomal protein S18 acetylase RimI-like enzyme
LTELSRGEVRRILDHRVDELVALWPDIPGTPLDEIVGQHLEREGFRFVIEEDEEGRLAGIAYGYLGSPGQWWHDRVATAMTAQQRPSWLRPGHFELVELAVRLDLRRRGIGSRLHDAVLEDERGPALLSTQVDNEPALSLYGSRGWETVVPEIEFPMGSYCVMGQAAPSGLGERVVA